MKTKQAAYRRTLLYSMKTVLTEMCMYSIYKKEIELNQELVKEREEVEEKIHSFVNENVIDKIEDDFFSSSFDEVLFHSLIFDSIVQLIGNTVGNLEEGVTAGKFYADKFLEDKKNPFKAGFLSAIVTDEEMIPAMKLAMSPHGNGDISKEIADEFNDLLDNNNLN